MKRYITIQNCQPYDGSYEVVGVHNGSSSWEQTLELRKVRNMEEHIAWVISETAANLVYAYRSAPEKISSARIKLAEAIKDFTL